MTGAAGPSRTENSVPRSSRGPRGRLRARLAGFAAAFGVLLGALAFPAAAQAADFNAWISAGQDQWIDIGGPPAVITVEVQATFAPGQGPKSTTVSASLSGVDGLAVIDVQDGGSCYRAGAGVAQCDNMTSGQQVQVQFLVAPMAESELPEGENRTGEVKVKFDGGEQKTSITVVGHAEVGPKSVGTISGTVTSNADPVTDAKVVLTDGEGTEHEKTTDSNGEFKFEGNDQSNYIAPGTLTLTVTKEGFEDLEKEFEVAEGSGFTQNITMKAQVAEEETTEAASSPPATSEAPSPVADEDDGGVSGTLIFLIIVGALLVIGGIVGIVFLLRGGKDDDKDDDAESFAEAPPEHQPTAAQVGTPGVYQAGPAPGQDAPTMIHNGPLVQDNEVGAYGAPTSAFGPAYGPGDDSTQVMPQAGGPAAPPPVGPNDTQILSTVKGFDRPGGVPPAPMSDSTQVMPQANLSPRPPQPNYSDPGATQPYQAPTPPPPPASRDPYAPQQSQPQPNYSDPGATRPYQGHGRDPYAPPPQPPSAPQPGQYGAPSQPPSAPSNDAYAPPARPPSAPQPGQYSQPPQQPPPPSADPYAPRPTQAMPQGGAPGTPRPPYGGDPAEDEGSTNSHRREDEERRGWGEWDDRPRSW